MGQPISDVPGRITSAAFQRRVHGALLDDAVVETDDGAAVQFSIKVGARVTENDPDFRDALILAWKAQRAGLLGGLVMPHTASGLPTLQHLLFLARQNDSVTDFMTRTTTDGVFAERHRVAACRAILNAAAEHEIDDNEFHSFLRSFVVIPLDFEFEPSVDEARTCAALEAARDISADQAHTLFSALVEISERLAIAAAATDVAGLERRLHERGVESGFPSDLRRERDALAAYVARTFESIEDTVADIHLDRESAVDKICAALSSEDVIVTGSPGAGKSTIVKNVALKLQETGPVLHLSGRRIEHAGSWPELAAEIGIPVDRETLHKLLATNSRGAIVVIDAIEHVISGSARAVINDLLHDLTQHGTPNVVLGVRDSALSTISWVDVRKLRTVVQVTVGDLSVEETAQISAQNPALGALLARCLGTFPGGLKLLSLLHDRRVSDAALITAPATESDLLDVWWEAVVVGDTVDRHDRFRTVLTAAEAVIAEPSGLFPLELSAPGAIIADLIRDGILFHDVGLDAYRFGHDIIQDWAIVHWLSGRPQETSSRIEKSLTTPGYYRSISLFAQRLAERDSARYEVLSESVAAMPDRRGVNAFLSALVLSPEASRLLEEHRDNLLRENGDTLATLLHIVEAEQVHLDGRLIAYLLSQGTETAEATAFAASEALPRLLIWGPLIAFCLQHIDELGVALVPFLRMALRWQKSTLTGWSHRRSLLDMAIGVLNLLERWRPHDGGPSPALHGDRNDAEKLARAIVVNSTDVDPDVVRKYLAELSEFGYYDDKEDMLGHLGTLSAGLTDEVIEFAVGLMISPDALPWEVDLDFVGIDNHRYFPASDVQGPFLRMLRTNGAAGLGLARRLAARATERYATRLGAVFRPLQFTFRGQTVIVYGDERAYGWFRPTAHDSSTLTSALMAVETWALEEIEGGRDPEDVLSLLLANGVTLPFVGIAVGLAYDYPDLIPSLTNLFARPWLWRLETNRATQDALPTDFSDILPIEMSLPDFKPHIVARNRDRDSARVQPRLPIQIAAQLLFDQKLQKFCDAFVSSAQQQTIIDATLFVEEAAAVEEDSSNESVATARDCYERFRRVTDPESYETSERGHLRLRPIPSDEQDFVARRREEILTWAIGINLRASKILRDYEFSDPNAFDAIAEALEPEAIALLPNAQLRVVREAVLRSACVACAFAPLSGIEIPAWSSRRVREAVQEYDTQNWHADTSDVDLMDMRVAVATALGGMFTANPSDADLRGYVFRLAARIELLDVLSGLLRGMIPIWQSRPSAVVSILSAMLEAATLMESAVPLNDAAFLAAEVRERTGELRSWPSFAAVRPTGVYCIGKLLERGLPLRFIDARAIAALVPLIEGLLAVPAPTRDDGYWQSFRGSVARLAASVLVGTGDEYSEFRARLSNWRQSQDVYGEVVASLVRSHFREPTIDVSIARFDEMADSFLRADHSATLTRRWLENEFRDTCWALIFVQNFEGVLVPAESSWISRFSGHIGRWIFAVGGHPVNASALLAFLERFTNKFAPSQIVTWLRDLIVVTPNNRQDELWQEQGRSILVVMLHLVSEHSAELSEPTTHRHAAAIAEQLVSSGIDGSGELRNRLETLQRGR